MLWSKRLHYYFVHTVVPNVSVFMQVQILFVRFLYQALLRSRGLTQINRHDLVILNSWNGDFHSIAFHFELRLLPVHK